VVIPYRWVTAVGDVVLIRHIKDQFKKPEETQENNNSVFRGGEEEQ